MILRTFKGGEKKFEEVRRFRISGHSAPTGATAWIRIGK